MVCQVIIGTGLQPSDFSRQRPRAVRIRIGSLLPSARRRRISSKPLSCGAEIDDRQIAGIFARVIQAGLAVAGLIDTIAFLPQLFCQLLAQQHFIFNQQQSHSLLPVSASIRITLTSPFGVSTLTR